MDSQACGRVQFIAANAANFQVLAEAGQRSANARYAGYSIIEITPPVLVRTVCNSLETCPAELASRGFFRTAKKL